MIGAEAQRKNDRTKLGVYRFVVPVRVEDTNGKIEKDGKKWTDYAVKLTVIEHAPGHHPGTVGNQFYTHELANIIVEMPGENAATGNNEYPLRTAVPGTPIDYRIGNLLGSVNIGRSGKTRWKIPEASKVVDANGEPLVVYHATDNDFTVFDRGRLGEFTDQNATDEVASQMARLGFWFSDHDIRKQTAQDNVKAVWLNIKNPYQASFEELWEALEGQTAEEFIAGLEKEGFDGIILDDTEFGGKSFVAFKSNQAKSATENSGAFDPANPDIRYSFLGERGAAALDQAEEATTRLDNLAIAREMEEAGKDAKTVKLATGWERGKDGIRYVQAFQRRGERSIVNVMIFVT